MRKKWIYLALIFSILAIVTGIMIVFKVQSDDTPFPENTNNTVTNTDKKTKSTTINSGEKINTSEEYDRYVKNLNKALLGNVNSTNFNWGDKSYVPVTFSTSPGVSYISIKLIESGAVEITEMEAAKGCLYAQVQKLQYAFVEVPKDFEGPLDSNATVVLLDNPNTCQ